MVDINVDGETEAECQCPRCGHKFKTNVHYEDTVDVDFSEFADSLSDLG